MTTEQQMETLQYFSKHADQWREKAISSDDAKVNVIRQRNDFVVETIRRRQYTGPILDVGCGTGDLVCDLARLGIEATGVDFAEEMVQIARRRVDHEQSEKAHFHCCSIFDFDLSENRYDAISANGFIEYISLAEMVQFLSLCSRALNNGGSLIIGSRNRLFNLISFNDYTLQEMALDSAIALMKEAIAISRGIDLHELADLETAPLQRPDVKHVSTGIEVSTRHQYTPAQLLKQIKKAGLAAQELYPIHIHGVPLAFKERNPMVHGRISNLLQEFGHDHTCLIPYASSFMVRAEKHGPCGC